jgi:hypothetical protein
VYRFALPDGVRKSVFVVVPLLTVLFYTAVAVLHPAVLHSPRTMWGTLASWCAATVALAVVHEACHAGVMRLAGARPRVGIRLRCLQPYALADGYRFRRGQWITSALAPLLVTVPLAGLLLGLYPNESWSLVLAIMAPVGCSGDVEMVLRGVHNSAGGDLIEDTKEGFAVLRLARGTSV